MGATVLPQWSTVWCYRVCPLFYCIRMQFSSEAFLLLDSIERSDGSLSPHQSPRIVVKGVQLAVIHLLNLALEE
jgi:hypothetical protein